MLSSGRLHPVRIVPWQPREEPAIGTHAPRPRKAKGPPRRTLL